MDKQSWVNNMTGELYDSFWHAVKSIVYDFLHFKVCRSFRYLSISKIDLY